MTTNNTTGGGLAVEATKLLDFNQKLDITLLDKFIGCMYDSTGEQVIVFINSEKFGIHLESS